MMSMMLTQNLEQRQTLLQKMELRSDWLESCLVRSEALMNGDSQVRAGLELIKHVYTPIAYQGVLDWLLGTFMPDMRSDIEAYYRGEGERLIAHRTWSLIDLIDRKMVVALHTLSIFRMEQLRAGWNLGNRRVDLLELTAAEIDLVIRPLFPVVQAGVEMQKIVG